ncbi:MAG: hypothetical protein KDA81_04750 [Planctomycetaceae bacterium]|nr:hypothetical protein [Planctomycetaceae bacterium]
MYGTLDAADAVLLVWQEQMIRQWHWLAGASTSPPLRCSEAGKVLWKKAGYWSRLKTGSEHPDLIEAAP